MKHSVTRRAVIGMLPSSLLATVTPPVIRKAKPLPQVGEFVRFVDPITENLVVRLTNPAYRSFFPGLNNRFISSRDRFLVFSSDRTGVLSVFRMDLHTGALTQVGQGTGIDPASLCLDATGRFLYWLDGGNLLETNLATRKSRTVIGSVSHFSVGESPAELAVVREGRLEMPGTGATLATPAEGPCGMRPGGLGCFYVRNGDGNQREFWYVATSPEIGKPVLLVRGGVSNPVWSPNGRSLLFLQDVQTPTAILSEIRETIPEDGTIRRVDGTSQFAAFAPNGDGSVFVGASRSRAQPNIILLLRDSQREMTLCEHRNSKPAEATPVFSPDSRRVFFQSDHEGKSALYTVSVDLLVEPTESYKP